MIVRKSSWICRLVMHLPCWFPVGAEYVRVGADISNELARIRVYGPSSWRW